MRDQALEQQRRFAEKQREQELKQAEKPAPIPVKVPLHTLAVEVPPQVLEVQTKLENPTRYHVMQKQKNQVKQYLSESFQGPYHPAFLSDYDRKLSINQTHSAPAPGATGHSISGPNSMTIDNVNSQSQSFHSQVTSNYDIASVSPALSSGATSASEVSSYFIYSDI